MTVDRGQAVPGEFESLVEAHGARLFRLAFLVLHDAASAEDAVQESLVRAWRQPPQARADEGLERWLTRVLLNVCRDEWRRTRRRERIANLLGLERPVADVTSQIADSDELATAMRRLSNEHRAVIVLRYYADFTAIAIADVLSIPEGTVRSRLHHGLRALRGLLEAESRGKQ